MGGATTPSYVEITRGGCSRRKESTNVRTIVASTSGMSPSRTTAPSTSSASARTPARNDVFMPAAYSGLCTGVQERPRNSASTRSRSWPTIASTGSSRAESAVSTARRTRLRLPIRTSILLRPIRVDRPAARTTPATRSPVMDTALSRAQMASGPPCVHGQELGDDADRHLLGTVRADVETDGCKQLLVVPGERAKYFLLARAWPEQAEIGERLSRERP